jgi:hypothetical protein
VKRKTKTKDRGDGEEDRDRGERGDIKIDIYTRERV